MILNLKAIQSKTKEASPVNLLYVIAIKETRYIPDRGENLFAAGVIF